MQELDCEESWVPKNWRFWTVVLEKTLASPLDCKEIQPVHPKGDQSWVFFVLKDSTISVAIELMYTDLNLWKFKLCLNGPRNYYKREGAIEIHQGSPIPHGLLLFLNILFHIFTNSHTCYNRNWKRPKQTCKQGLYCNMQTTIKYMCLFPKKTFLGP